MDIQKTITKLMLIYVVFTLIFPQFFLNKLCFLIILGMYIVFYREIDVKISAPLIIIGIFIYGFFVSFFNDSDTTLAVQFLFSVFALLMIYPIVNVNIEIEKIIKCGGIVLIIVDLLFVLYASNTYSLELPFGLGNVYSIIRKIIPESFFVFLQKYGETAIGVRGFFGDFDVMIHLGTIPFLYLPTCLWFEEALNKKKLKYFILTFFSLVAIFLSSSRALLLMTVGMIFFLFVINKKNKSRKLVVFAVVMLIALYLISFLIQNTDIFSSTETSNSVKIGHIKSVFTEMTALQSVFGKGLASYYYSLGVSREIAHTEITILDYVRYFGIPLAIIVFYKLISPLNVKIDKCGEKKESLFKIRVVFCGYLAISLTNPVLMNSMGIIVILWYWYMVFNLNKCD